MPRNGSGSYTAPSSSFNPAVPETAILSDDWNTTLDDLATALTGSMASDGQTPTTAMIPFALGASFGAGALATPSIAATGDLDTGFYFPAANQLSGVCGGIAFMQATSTGVTFSGNQTVTGSLTVNGSATLGDSGADALSVLATGTFTGNQTFNGTATFTSTVTVPDASFTNAKLANMATATIKGRVTAGTGVPEDLTGAQATTILSAFTGDSGSGGDKGLVPAPASGDAASFKFLRANGAWADVFAARGLFTGSTGADVGTPLNLSCTRNGIGDYSFAFDSALASANYIVTVTAEYNNLLFHPQITNKTTGGFDVDIFFYNAGTPINNDPTQISVLVVL